MKKFFTLIAAALISAGASAQTTTVGAEDFSTAFWGIHSPLNTVNEGQTLHMEFTNYTSGTENWNNWVIVFTDGAYVTDEGYSAANELAVVRADVWGWGSKFDADANKTFTLNRVPAPAEGEDQWVLFREEMKGAYVTTDAKIENGTLTFTAVTTAQNGAVWTESLSLNVGVSTMGVFFTVDGSYMVIEDSKTKCLPVIFDDWGDTFLINKTGVKAGDQFKFTAEAYTATGDAASWQWGPQILMKSNEDWSDLSMTLTQDNNFTFTLNEDDATKINSFGGLRIQGMAVKVLDWEYLEGQPAVQTDEEDIPLVDFSTWNGAESVDYNADGTLTFHSAAWGGLSKWLGEGDWSAYDKLVYEFAAPTTVDVQPFVQYAAADGSDVNETNYTVAGVTEASIDLNPDLKGKVKQYALQTAAPADIVVTRIYLVKSTSAIQNVAADNKANNAWYTLSGVRVAAPQKGIYIHNGKKIVVK